MRACVAVIELWSLHLNDEQLIELGLKAGGRAKFKQLRFDFSGASLRGMNLSGMKLQNARLEN